MSGLRNSYKFIAQSVGHAYTKCVELHNTIMSEEIIDKREKQQVQEQENQASTKQRKKLINKRQKPHQKNTKLQKLRTSGKSYSNGKCTNKKVSNDNGKKPATPMELNAQTDDYGKSVDDVRKLDNDKDRTSTDKEETNDSGTNPTMSREQDEETDHGKSDGENPITPKNGETNSSTTGNAASETDKSDSTKEDNDFKIIPNSDQDSPPEIFHKPKNYCITIQSNIWSSLSAHQKVLLANRKGEKFTVKSQIQHRFEMFQTRLNVFQKKFDLCKLEHDYKNLEKALSEELVALLIFTDPNYMKCIHSEKKEDAIPKSSGTKTPAPTTTGESIKLSSFEAQIQTNLIKSEDIKVGWSDIGGLDSILEDIQESIMCPLRYPKLISQAPLFSTPRGILLHGPPGCGKTLIAKAIAKESGLNFLNLDSATLLNKYYGESEKMIAAAFSFAKLMQPCIIFIDEIDSLLRARQSDESETNRRVKNLFMTYCDGLMTQQKDNVILIGATNLIDQLDPAILRRLPVKYEVKLPTEQQRRQIMEVMLKPENLAKDVDLEQLARMTDGFSGSDLRDICCDASSLRVRRFITDNPLKKEDIYEESSQKDESSKKGESTANADPDGKSAIESGICSVEKDTPSETDANENKSSELENGQKNENKQADETKSDDCSQQDECSGKSKSKENSGTDENSETNSEGTEKHPGTSETDTKETETPEETHELELPPIQMDDLRKSIQKLKESKKDDTSHLNFYV